MATEAEDLIAVRDNYRAQLVQLSAGIRPQYGGTGHAPNWPAYMQFLRDEIERLNALIAIADPVDVVTAIE